MALVPTKGGLLSRKATLGLARSGFDMMDRKRNILIREIMSLIGRAADIQSRIDSTFGAAYRSLTTANITLGGVAHIAQAVPVDDTVQIKYRSVMGVELPKVPPSEAPLRAAYGFAGTGAALDDAYVKFAEVKSLVRELAEVETSIYRLAFAIKKAQKRANALQNIIIPRLTREIKFITEALEEKEREEFSRLKVLKRR